METIATYVLDNVAMVRDEQERAHFRHVDLHTDETVGVAGQVVKSDALTEVECSFIECLPVPAPQSASVRLVLP